jgi:long-subunit fatty acid transport protein
LRRGGDGYNFVDENSEIAEVYRAAGSLRIGGEYLVNSNLSLRGGFENYASPFHSKAFGVSQPNADARLNVYSAGFGYRTGGFFFDMAYRYTIDERFDQLYPNLPTDYYAAPQMASFNSTKNSVVFTLGFKF